ncbi:hypothetical protein ACWGB8_10105 [Kitasatospora sp. NPDC054939]
MTTPAPPPEPVRRPERRHRPAPWVRTRLRSAPLAALLAAALAFGTVFLATALPRALDRGADAALREFLHDRGASATGLLATATPRSLGDLDPAGLDRTARELSARVGETFRVDGSPVHGARAMRPRPLINPGLASPDEVPPELRLIHLQGVDRHARIVEGRWPGADPTAPPAIPGNPGAAGTPNADGPVPIPVALAKDAADTIRIKLGDVLQTSLGVQPASAVVVGLYTADDPDEPYWTDLSCSTRACLFRTTGKLPANFWATTAVVGADAMPRLAEWGGGMETFWRIPVDTGDLRADQLTEKSAGLAALLTGRVAVELSAATNRPDLRIISRLPEFLDQARVRQAAAAPLAAVGPAGVAGVAAVVLCLAAALGADRRTAELRLLQARGGSRRGVLARLLGEGAVTVLPAAALATALALWLLPTPRWTAAVSAALATTLLALLAFPARAAVLWAGPRPATPRRRLVAELAVLAVTAAAALTVRRRGVNPAGEGVDLLLVTAPLLLALSGALLLARVQPLLVGVLARAAGRRRGAVGFLGLARAARGSGTRTRPSVLPMVALMLAVTTAGFGATVLDAVESARLHAARLTVGADAAVHSALGAPLPSAFTTAAAALPGVRAAAPVWTDSEAFLLGTSTGSTRVTVVVADPEPYAEIARTVGRGEFDPAALKGAGADGVIPALFSTDLAAKAGGAGTFRLRLANGAELETAPAARTAGTPLLQGTDRAVVVLPKGPVEARLPELGSPNVWLATGPVEQTRLEQLVRETATAGPGGTGGAAPAPAPTAATAGPGGHLVRTSAAVVAELAGDPLQRSAGRLFWASVLGAGGFALLAVLLTLLRAAPERVALLARLRTMGLRPRQGLALILAEALPQTLVAAVGGGLAALAAVALLGPAVDLSTLVGAEVPTGLSPALLPVLLQTAGLAALVTAGVLGEAALSGRRQISTELRVGDQR